MKYTISLRRFLKALHMATIGKKVCTSPDTRPCSYIFVSLNCYCKQYPKHFPYSTSPKDIKPTFEEKI